MIYSVKLVWIRACNSSLLAVHLCGSISAISSFYSDAQNIFDMWQVLFLLSNTAIGRSFKHGMSMSRSWSECGYNRHSGMMSSIYASFSVWRVSCSSALLWRAVNVAGKLQFVTLALSYNVQEYIFTVIIYTVYECNQLTQGHTDMSFHWYAIH